MERAEELRVAEAERQKVQDAHYQTLVDRLTESPIIIGVRVGEQGRLYGSVNNADIAEKAGEILGEQLDRRRILLGEAIRQVGVYSVQLRLSPNVQPYVSVVVVDEESPDGLEKAADLLLNPPENVEDVNDDSENEDSESIDSESDDAIASASESEPNQEEDE